jgi:hypothetical protein
MLKTYRQVISDIINDTKSNTLDDRLSFRFLYSKLLGRIETILRQDSQDRNILNLSSIWYPIKCLELQSFRDSDCTTLYEDDSDLMVSCVKIPKVFSGKNGEFIKVLNINNSVEYKKTKPFLYRDMKNREYFNKNTKYFWIEDDYIFIPDSQVTSVKLFGMFKNSKEADYLNNEVDKCFKILDSLILAPDYIIDVAKRDIVTEIRNINKTLVQDENPNLNNIEK